MASGGRGRVWPRRVSAAAAWLLAVVFLTEGVPGLWPVFWTIAGVLVWLAIGVWKGRRRPAIALVVLGLIGTVWYAGRALHSATWSEMVVIRRGAPDQLRELQRPTWWTVALGIEAALALVMAVAALPAARATRRALPEADPTEAVDA